MFLSLIFVSAMTCASTTPRSCGFDGAVTVFNSSDFYYAQAAEKKEEAILEENTTFNKHMLKIVDKKHVDESLECISGRKIKWKSIVEFRSFALGSPSICINSPKPSGNISPTSVTEFVEAKKSPVRDFRIDKKPLFWNITMLAFVDKDTIVATPKIKSCMKTMRELD